MLNDFLKILADYGLLGVGVIIAALLLYKFVSAKIDLWVITKKRSETDMSLKDMSDLKYHQFFSNAQYRLMVEIPNIEFDPLRPVRQKLFRDLVFRITKTMHDNFFKAIETDVSDWSPEQWANEMTVMVSKITVEFEDKARKAGVPDIVIEKFSRWHAPTTKMVNEYILALSTSKVYISNVARMNTLLMIMNLVLVTTMDDAERTLSQLNGELSGLEYKNLPIE